MDAVPSRGQVGALIFVVVCVLGLAVAPGVLAQSSEETEASFGAQISAFMQTSAADADTTVEQGMWNASIEGGAPAASAVDRHTRRIRGQLERLENRTESLRDARQNGSLTGVAYTAKASAVRAEVRNLRRAINETAETARRHGVNETALAELREAAGTMEGPEIAAIARNLTDGGPGPPANPGENGEQPTGEGSPGPPTDLPSSGPNADDAGPPTDQPGNATDRARGDEGNASGGEPPTEKGEDGPPDDSGQDQGQGKPADDAGSADQGSAKDQSGDAGRNEDSSEASEDNAGGADKGTAGNSDNRDAAGDATKRDKDEDESGSGSSRSDDADEGTGGGSDDGNRQPGKGPR